MKKFSHEVKDPIHAFIKFDDNERKVINSYPVQRLRHIHQLSLSYLVYPGATHRRFEHSLGVMELAGRVFDVITNPSKISSEVKELLGKIDINFEDKIVLDHWRKTLRFAALCHDLGHLPFSHAAENELMPNGLDHEQMTGKIILNSELTRIFEKMTPAIKPELVAKLALGVKNASKLDLKFLGVKDASKQKLEFNDWETVLSEIIVGNSFGVDRMDYLLRDAHHTGLIHGKFDHYRLIDTLRILTPPPETENGDKSQELSLGIEKGGLVTSEALLLSRYFMFSQVYFHPISKVYDIHLNDFLVDFMGGNKFPEEPDDYMKFTDNEINVAILNAYRDSNKPGHIHAKRIINREHFRVLYQRNPHHIEVNINASNLIFEAVEDKFGADHIRFKKLPSKHKKADFFVYIDKDMVDHALHVSRILKDIPTQLLKNEIIYIDNSKKDEAKNWLKKNVDDIISK